MVWTVAGAAYGQTYNEVLVHMPEMLQYQRQKGRAAEQGRLGELQVQPFKKLGFKRIHAKTVLDDDDPRHVWGFHVHANREFNKEQQALYRLFKKSDWGSMVVIDYFAANDNKCELVFWGKKYYRRFATELRRMGFQITTSSTQRDRVEALFEEDMKGRLSDDDENLELEYRDGHLYYAIVQIADIRKGLHRYICYQSRTNMAEHTITLVYMEGKASLADLRKTFKKK